MDYFIADDLSGALDAAAAFHQAGRRVVIPLSLDVWPDTDDAVVVGFTTESRNATAASAGAAVKAVIASGRRRGANLAYKKIDSTLRGQVAAELMALTDELPDARILFVPANPRVGRTVRNGVLLVHGVPVAETEFARDPVSPVRHSSIRQLLGAAATERVVIADAETHEALAEAVQRMDSAGGPWVAIGSGALAVPVARRLASGSARSASRPDVAGPILFVCGSAHAKNREQAALLTRDRGVPRRDVDYRDVQPAVREALQNIRAMGAAALMVGAERSPSGVALRGIVTAAHTVVTQAGVMRVFVTGGETAFALCRELRVATLDFATEIEPGLSLSYAQTASGPMLWAVKPGGFGDERTWLRAFDAMQPASRSFI